jgi:hypothetical protein
VRSLRGYIFLPRKNLKIVLGNLDFALEWDNPKTFGDLQEGSLSLPQY